MIEPAECRVIILSDVLAEFSDEEQNEIKFKLNFRGRYDRKISYSLMTINDFIYVLKYFSAKEKLESLLAPFQKDDKCFIELESSLPSLYMTHSEM